MKEEPPPQRVLIICPYFTPYINPRSIRWTAIARQWADLGWEVHVICSRHRGLPAEEIMDGIQVHRTGYNSLKEWVFDLLGWRRRGIPVSADPSSKPLRSPGGIRLLGALNRLFWSSVYWPDDAWIWYWPARIRAIREMRSQKFQAMISVGLPFTAHWVARAVKRRSARLTWVADCGDPFSLQPDHPLNNPWLYRRLNYWAERAVLAEASRVVVTNQGMYDLLAAFAPRQEEKIEIIPPIATLFGGEAAGKAPAEKLRVGYFGSFFRKIREPWTLFDLLFRMQTLDPNFFKGLEINLYGEIGELLSDRLEKMNWPDSSLRLHGLVSRAEVEQAISDMDVLLLIGNSTSFQLPSKSADFLASGKPILHLQQSEDDPCLTFFKDYPLFWPIRVKKSPTALDAAVLQAMEVLKKARGKSVSAEWLQENTRAIRPGQVAAAYADLLESR